MSNTDEAKKLLAAIKSWIKPQLEKISELGSPGGAGKSWEVWAHVDLGYYLNSLEGYNVSRYRNTSTDGSGGVREYLEVTVYGSFDAGGNIPKMLHYIEFTCEKPGSDTMKASQVKKMLRAGSGTLVWTLGIIPGEGLEEPNWGKDWSKEVVKDDEVLARAWIIYQTYVI